LKSLTVKGDWDQTHARVHAEDLVHGGTCRIDPAREIEIAQCWEEKVGEPVPAERAETYQGKESVTGNLPGIKAIIV